MLLFPYVFRDKYLSQPIIGYRSSYNELSGGFPHSDIHGSKPVPGSPWLNAGYHVLHRLLLPRHPPNALFALDLIQEEQGRWFADLSSRVSKACTFPPCNPQAAPVSVLDLEQYRLDLAISVPSRGYTSDTDVSLSTMSIRAAPHARGVALHPMDRMIRHCICSA